MTLIYSLGTNPVKYPIAHDPNESKYYSFCYRPKTRENSKEYFLDDVVITTGNGLYHVCVNPGVSAASTPSFATSLKGKTTDGTVIWKAVAFDLMLRTGDTISTSEWTSPDLGVTIDNKSISPGNTYCRVTAVPTQTSFTLTNSVGITRSDGKLEVFDRSILVNIKEL